MADVTIRQRLDSVDQVIERVEAGELLTVTHAGRPVAELRPVRRRALRVDVDGDGAGAADLAG